MTKAALPVARVLVGLPSGWLSGSWLVGLAGRQTDLPTLEVSPAHQPRSRSSSAMFGLEAVYEDAWNTALAHSSASTTVPWIDVLSTGQAGQNEDQKSDFESDHIVSDKTPQNFFRLLHFRRRATVTQNMTDSHRRPAT
ncbi:hypothetical protein B0T22DRAFT_436688 [Podospora appendiculata]|uniref:Uncharacterized protein n=1 Tax=Podospora appendiculata TaxID=314037 RepID=A0AAE0XHQ1_9PEZI|nr:hypothetical protein B0T22DRAFT_436688 [Podospora appendiculata]